MLVKDIQEAHVQHVIMKSIHVSLRLDGPLLEESFARIREVLDTLPVADREILTLRYALEREAPEIAETLGIASTAVHMRLSRARQRLAEKLTAIGMTGTGES